MTLNLGLVGLGKIARDQHLPAIAATPGLRLAAIASRSAPAAAVPVYPDVAALLAGAPEIGAVTLCTPPQGRFAQARAVLLAGRHLMLEKPPGMTLAEVGVLADLAAARGLTLFATWHSREGAGVAPARAALEGRTIRHVRVDWREDVRRWHPGQQWVWEPGGLGVFDPGINAISIVTAILPEPMRLERAELAFPAGRAAPIAADLRFLTASGAPVEMRLDWRPSAADVWDIEVESDGPPLRLTECGGRLSVAGAPPVTGPDTEYRRLYARFAALVAAGDSDVDLTPLTHVADAFLIGRRLEAPPFEE